MSRSARAEKVATLEVSVGMYDSVQLRSRPAAVLFDSLQLSFVGPIEHAVASDVVSLPLYVLLHASQKVPIVDACCLQERQEIVQAEVPVGTAMALARAGRMFCQDLLTREWRVAPAPTDGISANISMCMADVVPVFLVEGLIRDELEGVSPKDEAFLQRKADALEEERVLQSTKVFQMTVLAQVEVQVAHAQREVLRQEINRARVKVGSRESAVGVCKRRVWRREVLG